MTTAITERVAALESLHLEKGAHENPDAGMCAMEAAAWIAGESHSDHPACVCPVLGAFVRAWNDGLSDGERDATLKPILTRLIGTKGSEALEVRRALMAGDWLVRVNAPAWLRLAGLGAHADTLSALPEITTLAQAASIRGPIEAAGKDARAAWTAACRGTTHDAAWTAAWTAAWHVAWTASMDAAGAASVDAAGAASVDAAVDAAWVAAWHVARAAGTGLGALKETRLALQHSAAELVVRMIEAPDQPEPTEGGPA